MRFLFIMGPSGSGKSTLARNLEKRDPELFKRIIQYTTRPARPKEKNGREYLFIGQGEYDQLDSEDKLIAVVREEFPPFTYGTPRELLDEDRINLVVVSIEATLHSAEKLISEGHDVKVLFINDVKKPEKRRDGRYFEQEQKYTSIVLNYLEKVSSVTIPHDEFKKIRNNYSLLKAFFEQNNLI